PRPPSSAARRRRRSARSASRPRSPSSRTSGHERAARQVDERPRRPVADLAVHVVAPAGDRAAAGARAHVSASARAELLDVGELRVGTRLEAVRHQAVAVRTLDALAPARRCPRRAPRAAKAGTDGEADRVGDAEDGDRARAVLPAPVPELADVALAPAIDLATAARAGRVVARGDVVVRTDGACDR